MAKVGRLTDKISCNDRIAQGSTNVFANSLPVSILSKPKTTGHPSAIATVLIGPFSSTVFVNNVPVTLIGKTKIAPHPNNNHTGTVSSGSPNVEIE